MGLEIERKFLVKSDTWKHQAAGTVYRQGYLCNSENRVVRIRSAANKAWITVKGPTAGASRKEFEYEIPLSDAEIMLTELCQKPLIEKTRYKIEYHGMIWEVDEFSGDNSGLIIAEVELTHENQAFQIPDWIDREVTGDHRYHNSNLVTNPFCLWK